MSLAQKASGARKLSHLLLGGAAGFAGMVGPSAAQELDAGEPKAAAGLQEIVVTARKREEDLQDTPISISAFSGAELEARGLTDVSQIARLAPNMQFDTTSSSSGGSFISVVFLRGVGQTDFLLTVEPGVGTYVDGVYVSRSVGGVFDVLNLERVEVLRGPQGTLFGKNTIGGAVSLVTRKPRSEFGGSLSTTIGTDERLDLRADVDIPLGDKAALQLVASSRNQEGYVERVLTDKDPLGDINRDVGRAALRLNPTENLEINLSLEGARIREEGTPSAGALYNCDAPATTLCRSYNNLFADPGAPSSFVNNQYRSTDPDITFQTGDTRSDLDLYGTALTLDWDVGPISIKSITAYRDLEANLLRDSDNTPINLSFTRNDYESQQFSQEVQFLGESFDGKLDWVAGLYYLKEDGQDDSTSNLTLVAANNLAKIENTSYAVFGQGTYSFTDKLSATAGLRYTKEDKDLFLSVARLNGTFIVPPGDNSQSFDNVSPRLGLEYKVTPDLLTYVSVSRGFKSGGYNIRYLTTPTARPLAFEPEELTAYEAGYKWQSADNRLRWNSAVFYSDYDDLQVLVRNAIATQITNAGKAQIYGLESELEAAVTDHLTAKVAVGYTIGEYDEVPPIIPPATANDQIELNDEFAKTPKFTFNFALDYTRELTGQLEFLARADWSYRSDVYNDAVNAEIAKQDAYHLVNFGAGFGYGGSWRAMAFVNNAFDERYLLNAQSGLTSVGFAEYNWSRGREYGLTITYDF